MSSILLQETSSCAVPSVSNVNFSDLGVQREIVAALTSQNVTTPTPIQQEAIPVALGGSDVIGIARTGTGKSFAFCIPIVQKLLAAPGQGLIIVPTRELALQAAGVLNSVSRNLKARMTAAVLIGGAPMHTQIQALRKKPRVIVATPGRLGDHLQRRTVSLSTVSVVCLDEADRMFDMGFAPQIQSFLDEMPAQKQALLFSATMPVEVEALVQRHLTNPVRIDVTPKKEKIGRIAHELCYVSHENKGKVLRRVLGETEGLTIVFSRTKHGASDLARRIQSMGYSSTELHSNRSLSQRRHALTGFKAGKYQVLVATDIAARGIDVDDVKLVVNYDLPGTGEDYIHRIGRTGRAGRSGRAVSFATADQVRDVRVIEKVAKVSLSLTTDSEPRPQERVQSRGKQAARGGGPSMRWRRGPRDSQFRPQRRNRSGSNLSRVK